MTHDLKSWESTGASVHPIRCLIRDATASRAILSLRWPPVVLLFLAMLAPAGIGTAQSPTAASPAPSPIAAEEQRSDAPSKFDRLVTRIVLESMPHQVIDEDDWGHTKDVWDGVKIWWENGRLETKRRRKNANHGTWKRYEIHLVDPELVGVTYCR